MYSSKLSGNPNELFSGATKITKRSLSIRGHDLRHGELFDRTLHSLGGQGWVGMGHAAPGSTGQHRAAWADCEKSEKIGKIV